MKDAHGFQTPSTIRMSRLDNYVVLLQPTNLASQAVNGQGLRVQMNARYSNRNGAPPGE